MLKVPQELGFGPGTTCWRRLKRWIDAGVFDQLHQILLERLNAGNRMVTIVEPGTFAALEKSAQRGRLAQQH